MIAGSIDLTRTAAALPAPVASGSRQSLDAPGLSVHVDGREADLYAADGFVVACEGRPVFRDDAIARCAAQQGQAAAWAQLLRGQGPERLAAAGGEYAVVALDLAAGTALAACDRFAIRPLCYRAAAGQFAFASRADQVAGGDGGLDPQALFEYLYFHMIPTPRTVFRGVSRLRAAHYVRADAQGAASAPHWQPRFQPRRDAGLPALEEEFRQIVRAGVAREAGGRRTACFLSGGTDSSTVTGMLGEFLGSAPTAYSIGFDAEGYDEMGYARIAARRYGAQHREYYITPADLVQGIPLVARHYDQPFGNSSALPAYYCARQAVAEGFERILAGDGGDELFGGNSRYAKQRVFAVYDALPAGLRSGLIEPLALGVGLWSHVPLVKKGVSYVRQARVPMPARMETYNLLDRLGMQRVLTPAFLGAADLQAPARQQAEVYREVDAHLVDAMLAYDWKYTLADNDLPKVVGTTGLAGIEVGFPLLTDELTDFSLRLPASYKVRGLTLRWFFKRALRDFLPVEILRKTKHGFGLPFGPWLLKDPALMRLAQDSMAGLAERNVVQRAFLDELLAKWVPEVPGYYGGMVWVLMMLEQWLEQRAPGFRI